MGSEQHSQKDEVGPGAKYQAGPRWNPESRKGESGAHQCQENKDQGGDDRVHATQSDWALVSTQLRRKANHAVQRESEGDARGGGRQIPTDFLKQGECRIHLIGLDHTEDGRSGSDSQAEGQNGNDREKGAPPKAPETRAP